MVEKGWEPFATANDLALRKNAGHSGPRASLDEPRACAQRRHTLRSRIACCPIELFNREATS